MAAYAARGGMRSLVLVPEGKISWSKLSQALDYGAVTCQLKTDFDGCLQLLQQLVLQAPVYQLNSINPFRLEGQKTLALELLEQLDWERTGSHHRPRRESRQQLCHRQGAGRNE